MKTMNYARFLADYNPTGKSRQAICGGKKELMEEIYSNGEPIWVDLSYYVQHEELYLIEKDGDHFVAKNTMALRTGATVIATTSTHPKTESELGS